MVDRALYDFAEATVGHNSDLAWILSEDITRRQMAPVFKRCAQGDLSPSQALDVCMDCLAYKLRKSTEVFEKLYNTLADRLGVEYNHRLDSTLTELQEYFMGLNNEATWSTSVEITKEELLPMFERCAQGNLSSEQALEIYLDNVLAKRDHTLSILKGMIERVALSWKLAQTEPEVRMENDQGEQA